MTWKGSAEFLVSELAYEVSKWARRHEISGTVSFLTFSYLPCSYPLIPSRLWLTLDLTLRAVLVVGRGYLRRSLAQDGTPFYPEILCPVHGPRLPPSLPTTPPLCLGSWSFILTSLTWVCLTGALPACLC